MLPILIPSGHPDEHFDLLKEVITRQYSFGNSQYYFALYPEYPNKFLSQIDEPIEQRYLVVLYSVTGTTTFEIIKKGDAYHLDIEIPEEPDEFAVEKMLFEVAGVHTKVNEPFEPKIEEEVFEADAGNTEQDEGFNITLSDDEMEDRLQLTHWLKIGSEAAMLPLINAAIAERKSGK